MKTLDTILGYLTLWSIVLSCVTSVELQATTILDVQHSENEVLLEKIDGTNHQSSFFPSVWIDSPSFVYSSSLTGDVNLHQSANKDTRPEAFPGHSDRTTPSTTPEPLCPLHPIPRELPAEQPLPEPISSTLSILNATLSAIHSSAGLHDTVVAVSYEAEIIYQWSATHSSMLGNSRVDSY